MSECNYKLDNARGVQQWLLLTTEQFSTAIGFVLLLNVLLSLRHEALAQHFAVTVQQAHARVIKGAFNPKDQRPLSACYRVLARRRSPQQYLRRCTKMRPECSRAPCCCCCCSPHTTTQQHLPRSSLQFQNFPIVESRFLSISTSTKKTVMLNQQHDKEGGLRARDNTAVRLDTRISQHQRRASPWMGTRIWQQAVQMQEFLLWRFRVWRASRRKTKEEEDTRHHHSHMSSSSSSSSSNACSNACSTGLRMRHVALLFVLCVVGFLLSSPSLLGRQHKAQPTITNSSHKLNNSSDGGGSDNGQPRMLDLLRQGSSVSCSSTDDVNTRRCQ